LEAWNDETANSFFSYCSGISLDGLHASDLNDDCKVDFADFALMAENWLVDCRLDPTNPACVPK